MSYENFCVSGLVMPGASRYVHVDRKWVTDPASHVSDDERVGDVTAAVEAIVPGWLTRLWVGHVMVMSDGYREYLEHAEAIGAAHGRVLVNGLGLGCYVKAILAKPEVSSVEVVEVDRGVIELIGPHYESDPRVTIIHADAYEQAKRWPRGTRWDYAWSDIWPTVSVADLPEHERLLRSYGQRVGRQGAWIHGELLAKRRAGVVSIPDFEKRMRETYGMDVHVGSIPEWC